MAQTRKSRRDPAPAPPPQTGDEARGAVAAEAFWWHSIDLGDDVVTPGHKTPEQLEHEWKQMDVGDLRGQSFLDIGAWDGWFSFRAEQEGAERVVALDHFVWQRDLAQYADRPPDTPFDPPAADPIGLPGKRPFNLAHRTLGSRVEPVAMDFMDATPDNVGVFDKVLFSGVLYHVRDPLGALCVVRELTRTHLIIETQATEVGGQEDVPLNLFVPNDEYFDDPTNWWFPNARCVLDMCRAAGFGTAIVKNEVPRPEAGELAHYRLFVHAW